MIERPSRGSLVIAIAAVGFVAVIAVAIARLWNSFGPSEISPAGWLAMTFGVILTLAVGVGLMALVFISNRRGWDDPSRHDGG